MSSTVYAVLQKDAVMECQDDVERLHKYLSGLTGKITDHMMTGLVHILWPKRGSTSAWLTS